MSRGSVALALSIPAVALIELLLYIRSTRVAPTPDDWRAARPRVEALRQPGDLVLIAPRWIDPHARQALGPDLLPLRDLARPDESSYPRAVEVSAMGQRSSEVASWPELSRHDIGKNLVARVLQNPRPARVVADFVDLVERGEARVAWVVADRPEPCPLLEKQAVIATGLFGHPALPPRRHSCGPQPWQSVAVTVHDDQRFLPRRCVWSPPPEQGFARIQLTTPLGQRVRGHSSIHWTLERERRGAPYTIDLLVDGEPVASFTHEDGQGWAPFEAPLGPHAGKPSAQVELRVRSADARERHVCWHADTRD